MSIRMKAFIYIVFFFVIMAVLVLAVQRSIIFPSFIKIEYNETAENMLRVTKSIDREIFYLDKLCHDWAAWNDTYDFIENRSEQYLENNLLYEAFSNNNVNLMFFFKSDGSVFWGQAYDLKTGEPLDVDFLDVDKLDPSHLLISLNSSRGEETDMERSGIIDTSQGPMIFVSRPILQSDGSGPARGVLTMGRFMTQMMIDSLKDQTRIDFGIDYPLTKEKIRSIYDSSATHIEDDLTFFTLVHDQYTDVRTFYSDVYGNPIFSIYFRFPRDITRQGLASIWYAFFLFIGAGMVVSVILIIQLQCRLVRPLQRLTAHALRMESEKDFSARLNFDREDEIGTLAKSFDRMMATIDERTEELKTANEMLTQLSQIDGLTGIANRRMFNESIARLWRRMTREKGCLSLILADVDYFKKYHDIYGHQMGDECLVEVAGAITQSIHRPDDVGARYGGEEFAVILADTDERCAFFIAEKIRTTIMQRNIEHKGSDIHPSVTMSLGLCSVVPQQDDEIGDFIKNADHALYFAKEKGRNRTVIFGRFSEILPGERSSSCGLENRSAQ